MSIEKQARRPRGKQNTRKSCDTGLLRRHAVSEGREVSECYISSDICIRIKKRKDEVFKYGDCALDLEILWRVFNLGDEHQSVVGPRSYIIWHISNRWQDWWSTWLLELEIVGIDRVGIIAENYCRTQQGFFVGSESSVIVQSCDSWPRCDICRPRQLHNILWSIYNIWAAELRGMSSML